ncbi:hypothetical protein E4T47_03300 [Aureobasidium subglaciale]|nr:hypothetical protein E4T43_04891 [Aureobasidium subglaciale]KAI5273430.1 hypothetical protein E4T47_03300 [Aureobasidium subglaciale]
MGMPGFLFLSFPCSSSSHTFHSLRKAYTFFIILGFGSLVRPAFHTHSLERSPLVSKDSIRPRYKAISRPSSVRRSLRLHGTPSAFPEAINANDHLMIRRNSNVVTINMGRGAYDTTGTLKPGQPPPPKPR